jgi:ferredoxin-type protein NapH
VSEVLPDGGAPAFINRPPALLGGGIAAEYVSIPLMDPVAGALALIHADGSWRAWVALALPVLLALVAGRVFCGWLCPFGVLARGLDRLLDLAPWRPRYRVPRRRPLRWLVLGGAIAASLMGVHLLLYLSLPYLLLQQSVYAMWLLGGGGAVLAVLLGLLVAGVIIGPTSYCAALCPTGAALSFLGRARPMQLTIAEPSACGRRCQLCDDACWLHLDPASGDAGPDCDLCMRCVAVCPRSNLRFKVGKTAGAVWPILPLLVVACGFSVLLASPVTAEPPMRKPRLLLEREHTQGAVTLAISVVDFSGVALDADVQAPPDSAEVSLFLARGARGKADVRGVLPRREVYAGPLRLRLQRTGVTEAEILSFDAPTSPISTSERTIYRRRLHRPLAAGDAITLHPVRGWLEQPVTWIVPPTGSAASSIVGLQCFGAALLIFIGVLSLAFAVAANGRDDSNAKRARAMQSTVDGTPDRDLQTGRPPLAARLHTGEGRL